ncbi:lytic transglycosylase domain-containing protein [bacterium]|nr:MAG: lytic transglycosylase domain-containing protein [bacterium]
MRPTRTPLAVLLAGSLVVPSRLCAQVSAAAVQAARPAASVSVLKLPSLDERRHYLADRVDGWHVMIGEKTPLAKDFLPEMAALKKSLLAVKDPEDLRLWGYVVDSFETRLMERLDPRLPQMDLKERAVARQAIFEQKEALVALNRAQASADPAKRAEITELKKKIKSMGLESEGLSAIYDRTAALSEGTYTAASANIAAPDAVASFTDWNYPRPYIPQRAHSEGAVPDPYAGVSASFGPPTEDERKVIELARQHGMNSTIVRQAFLESRRQGVDFRMTLAIIDAESNFNPRATSGVGAKGLMQIMPGTGRGLGVSNSNMLYDVATNIRAGVKYIKGLFNQFSDVAWSQLGSVNPWTRADVKSAIAAYNAGPGAVNKYGGVPPYRETRGYVVKVLQNYQRYSRIFAA